MAVFALPRFVKSPFVFPLDGVFGPNHGFVMFVENIIDPGDQLLFRVFRLHCLSNLTLHQIPDLRARQLRMLYHKSVENLSVDINKHI